MTTVTATVLSALIAAAASILVCVINNNKQNALLIYRLEQLEKKQDRHNNLIERMYRVEEQTALQEEKIKVANNRIADLENTAGGKSA